MCGHKKGKGKNKAKAHAEDEAKPQGEDESPEPPKSTPKANSSHYTNLSIASNASTAGIRAAYRTLALVCHPDKNPDDPTATANFQTLLQAYTVLVHPALRTAYDYGLMVKRHMRAESNDDEDVRRQQQREAQEATDTFSRAYREESDDEEDAEEEAKAEAEFHQTHANNYRRANGVRAQQAAASEYFWMHGFIAREERKEADAQRRADKEAYHGMVQMKNENLVLEMRMRSELSDQAVVGGEWTEWTKKDTRAMERGCIHAEIFLSQEGRKRLREEERRERRREKYGFGN